VLEGAKIELNGTDGTPVGNGYTRYDIFCEFSVINVVTSCLTSSML